MSCFSKPMTARLSSTLRLRPEGSSPKSDHRRPATEKRRLNRLQSSVNSHRSSKIGCRIAAVLIGILILAFQGGTSGSALLTAGSSTTATASASTPLSIKFATLAPQGSTWMVTLREMDAEIRRRSGGRVHFIFYPGGVLGDEIDVLRKIRIGQLHGGAFSGVGLGSVVPSVRVLELPLLFRDAEEADFVTGRLEEYFARAFEKRGFIFLTFAEAGPVHLFSQKAIRRRQDLQGIKMWAWHGDPLAAALFSAYQVAPVPLALPDVFPSLHTGLIDAFYAPPLAAIALQWFSQVSYMSTEGYTRATGGMLISQSRWEAIPAEFRVILRDVAKKYGREVVVKTRHENREALAALTRHGIQPVDLDPEERRQLLEISRQLWEEQAGKLYPRSLLNQVKSLLQKYRGKGSGVLP